MLELGLLALTHFLWGCCLGLLSVILLPSFLEQAFYLDPWLVSVGKNLPAMQETPVQFLGWEDPLEKGKATHSSILAWRIPWTL